MEIKFRIHIIALCGLMSIAAAKAFATDSQCDSGDPEALCDRMRDSSGKIIKPSKTVIALLQAFNGKIKEAAQLYGVDPRAVVGAIMAENSMNITKDRSEVKNYLRMLGQTGDSLYKMAKGHSFSRGMGGVNAEAASWAEKLAAQTEKRQERGYNEIDSALATEEGSIKYVAAIIRKVQDTYKAQGIDISKDPGLLASVFNLGGAEARAKKAKEENRMPRYNYFGQFVAANTDSLDEVLNYKPLIRDASNSASFANGDVKTYSYPPDCGQKSLDVNNYTAAVNNPYQFGEHLRTTTASGYKDKSFNQPGPSGRLAGFYKVMDRSVDCDGAVWVLASGSNKNMGWVKESDLKDHTSFLPQHPESCKPDAVKKCQDEIGRATKGSLNSLGRETNGILSYRLNVQDPGRPFDIKKWVPECVLSDKALSDKTKKNGNGYAGGMSGLSEMKRADVAKYQKALEAKRDEIRGLVGNDVDNRSFPLYDLLHTDLSKCAATSKCYLFNSYSMPQNAENPRFMIDDFLGMDMKNVVNSLSAMKRIGSQYAHVLNVVDGAETTYGEAIKEMDAQCGNLLSGDFSNLFGNSSYNYGSMYKDWSGFKNYMKSNFPNSDDTKVSVKEVTETLSACARLNVHRSNYAITPSCSNPLYRAAVEAQAGTQLTPFMKKALSSKADQDEFLQGTLGWLWKPQYGNYNNGIGVDNSKSDCNYQPNKLEEDIDKIRNLNCIEAIMVPDLNVVRHYTSQNVGNVVLTEFENADRYALKIKDACNEK